jgi:hypothetical protein
MNVSGSGLRLLGACGRSRYRPTSSRVPIMVTPTLGSQRPQLKDLSHGRPHVAAVDHRNPAAGLLAGALVCLSNVVEVLRSSIIVALAGFRWFSGVL